MKKAVLLLFIFAFACNSKEHEEKEESFTEITKIEGELTRDNVENLVRTGLQEKPIYATAKVPQHFNSLEAFNKHKLVQQLISDDMLQYDTLESKYYKHTAYEFYLDIEFENFKSYQTDILGKMVATYRMDFDSIVSIREVPQMNLAEVKVRFKKSNDGTPFTILDSITPDHKEMRLALIKEIDGWIYGGSSKFELKNED